MKKTKHSDYFNKVKADHQSELVEDYVEEIATLFKHNGEVRSTDLAQRFGVSAAAVSKMIRRLNEQGLVTSMPYRGIFLTGAGQALAEKVAYRHRIVFEMLLKLGVPESIAHADTEGIEHHCSEETVKAMCHFLEQPYLPESDKQQSDE
ncbi:manganese-binding transcriptional regulator MntR [Vibrio palustris]|uniref:Transcriptional regulator MntR n=1 Tax=Vibrio palustris TaxID=1918946 RepID=A0A1R4B388_9VIBR|nr:manganese-binding transcriptional regulator MntR [Vibrio palustris]SJL83379.1 Transcriptional regulator MntR [Vibrio palustris]